MYKMDIKEFREKGYLQECNRQFLHPLGLALSVKIDEKGNETLDSILYTDDKEGFYYNINNSNEDRKNRFLKNMIDVKEIKDTYSRNRKEILGFDIEPIIN